MRDINAGTTSSIINGTYSIFGTNAPSLIGPKVVTTIGWTTANIAATLAANTAVATTGGTVTYTTTVTNHGPATLAAGDVQVNLPQFSVISSWTYTCAAMGGRPAVPGQAARAGAVPRAPCPISPPSAPRAARSRTPS